MNSASRLVAAVFAAALLMLPVAVKADNDKTAAKPAATEKTAEATPPADSTTEGAVDAERSTRRSDR